MTGVLGTGGIAVETAVAVIDGTSAACRDSNCNFQQNRY